MKGRLSIALARLRAPPEEKAIVFSMVCERQNPRDAPAPVAQITAREFSPPDNSVSQFLASHKLHVDQNLIEPAQNAQRLVAKQRDFMAGYRPALPSLTTLP